MPIEIGTKTYVTVIIASEQALENLHKPHRRTHALEIYKTSKNRVYGADYEDVIVVQRHSDKIRVYTSHRST